MNKLIGITQDRSYIDLHNRLVAAGYAPVEHEDGIVPRSYVSPDGKEVYPLYIYRQDNTRKVLPCRPDEFPVNDGDTFYALPRPGRYAWALTLYPPPLAFDVRTAAEHLKVSQGLVKGGIYGDTPYPLVPDQVMGGKNNPIFFAATLIAWHERRQTGRRVVMSFAQMQETAAKRLVVVIRNYVITGIIPLDTLIQRATEANDGEAVPQYDFEGMAKIIWEKRGRLALLALLKEYTAQPA